MRDDTCASCGKPLVTLPHGARLRCCGKGYWSDRAPLPRDRWWTVRRKDGRYLYEKRGRMTA